MADTGDDNLLAEMAQAFSDSRIAPYAVEWDRERHFPLDVLRAAAELGMAGIYCREDIGGSGLGRRQAAIIFEALASGCPTIAAFLSIHNMVAWMVDRLGGEALRSVWGERLCGMQVVASYCLTEPSTGSDAAALRTTARADGGDFILNGTKQFISGAGVSDVYLVMVRSGDDSAYGISAVLVEKDTKGLSFGKAEYKMGWNAQPTAQVIFEDCRIPKANLLGELGSGFHYALQGLNGGRVNIAACSVGGARRALQVARDYAGQRQAFGKLLNRFQNTQFKLAELHSDWQACYLMLLWAGDSLDSQVGDYVQKCAMAKLFCSDNGFRIANEALQILGGYGYLSEYGIEKIVRDLRVHQILEGTNEIMRLIIARGLWDNNA